jgi:hypothetical protein
MMSVASSLALQRIDGSKRVCGKRQRLTAFDT